MPRELPTPSAQAFALTSPSPKGRALLLHGYTGCPYEVRPVADALHERLHLDCAAPLLPGHGDDPALLNVLPAEAFVDAAVDAWDVLMADAPEDQRRIVVGNSMGGLLALQVAHRRRVDGIVLMAPALRFTEGATAAIALLATGLWRVRPFLTKEGPGGDVGDVDAVRLNPTYKVMPTGGLVQLLELQLRTERMLPTITAPLCLLHGERDHTIPPSSSRRIAERVSSTVVEHHRLPRTQHLVGLDVERDLVCDLVCDFVGRVRPRPGTLHA